MRSTAIIACVAGVGFAVAIHAAFHREGSIFPERVAFGDRAVTALTFALRARLRRLLGRRFAQAGGVAPADGPPIGKPGGGLWNRTVAEVLLPFSLAADPTLHDFALVALLLARVQNPIYDEFLQSISLYGTFSKVASTVIFPPALNVIVRSHKT
jgi:hypothetical protein